MSRRSQTPFSVRRTYPRPFGRRMGRFAHGASRSRCWLTPTSACCVRWPRTSGKPEKGDSEPDLRAELIPPTVPEVRRLVCATIGPAERRGFKLGWALFRRAHQAVARRCHRATHGTKHSASPKPVAATAPAGPVPAGPEPPDGLSGRGDLRLTDEEWAKVEPLLPPQKPPVGCPARDHRAVVGAILWVLSHRSMLEGHPEGDRAPEDGLRPPPRVAQGRPLAAGDGGAR